MSTSNEINLTQIQTALLMPITGQYIEEKLGIKPVRAEKRAKFWSRDQFTDICQGIITHVTAARNVNFDLVQAERKSAKPKVDDDPFAGMGDAGSAAADDPFAGVTGAAEDDPFAGMGGEPDDPFAGVDAATEPATSEGFF
jgi:hypothetical protein